MSIFASSAASFQPVISEAVNAVGRNRFVGSQILPFYGVDKSQGKYPKINAAQFDNDITKPRAAGSNFAQTSSEYTSATFECLEYGAENALLRALKVMPVWTSQRWRQTNSPTDSWWVTRYGLPTH